MERPMKHYDEMNYQRAIRVLTEQSELLHLNSQEEFELHCAYRRAIETLKLQQEMKASILHICKKCGEYSYKCTNCDSEIEYPDNHCSNCGQKIKWDSVEGTNSEDDWDYE